MALPTRFKDIANAQAVTRSDRFLDGKGTLIVRNVICEKKFNGEFFIMEFAVLNSEKKGDKPCNQAGTTAAIALNLTKNIAAAGNAKAFVLALLGIASDPNLGETMQEICNARADALRDDDRPFHAEQNPRLDVQPARGMLIGYETYHTNTKAGSDFMGVNFSHVDNSDEAAVKARRDALGLDGAPKF